MNDEKQQKSKGAIGPLMTTAIAGVAVGMGTAALLDKKKRAKVVEKVKQLRDLAQKNAGVVKKVNQTVGKVTKIKTTDTLQSSRH